MNKVTMNLTTKDVENTDKLKERLHARSKAEVVSTSLSVTASLSDFLKNGGELMVRNKDGVMEKIHITGLD